MLVEIEVLMDDDMQIQKIEILGAGEGHRDGDDAETGGTDRGGSRKSGLIQKECKNKIAPVKYRHSRPEDYGSRRVNGFARAWRGSSLRKCSAQILSLYRPVSTTIIPVAIAFALCSVTNTRSPSMIA